MARRRSGIDTRIVHAARMRFLHDGVDGASLRAIAEDAGTNVGMIYYYFPTKDDLFLAVVEELYARIIADLAAALSAPAGFEERLRAAFARFAALSDDELTVMRLVIREVLVSSARRGRLIDRFMHGHMPLVGRVLVEGSAAGRVTSRHPIPVLTMVTVLVALMPQVARRLVGDALPGGITLPAPDEIAQRMLDVLLHGIAGPTTGPSLYPPPSPPSGTGFESPSEGRIAPAPAAPALPPRATRARRAGRARGPSKP